MKHMKDITNRITKKNFEKSFRQLTMNLPLEKITVKDITEYSGMSRNSFYYHFNDKYELMNWIFYSGMVEKVDSLDDPYKVTESFVNVCKRLSDEREFYYVCFQYTGQNSLFEFLYNIFFELWKANLTGHYRAWGVKCTKGELILRAQLNTYAMIGVVHRWVKEGMNSKYIRSIEKVREILDIDSLKVPGKNQQSEREKESYPAKSIDEYQKLWQNVEGFDVKHITNPSM